MRTGLCALTALALTAVMGTVARADPPNQHSQTHGAHTHVAAIAVQPQVKAMHRAPVGLDAAPAEAASDAHSVEASASVATPQSHGGITTRAEHSRDPPGGEHA
jgi:hypothetical protein